MSSPTEFDYKKYLQLLARRKQLFFTVALSVMLIMVVVSYLLPEQYEAKSTVFIEKSIINEMVRGIAVAPSIDDKIRVLAYAMKSRPLLLKVIDDLDLNASKQNDAALEGRVKALQKDTDIKLKDKEGLFIISYVGQNPRFARDYVNALIRRYIEENISSKREDSYGATKFLSEQIATVKQKLDKAEADVDAFKRGNGSAVAAEQATVMREIADTQQRIEEIRMRRAELEGVLKPAVKRHPLQPQIAALQKTRDELRAAYTESYPEIIRINAEVESLREQMRSQPNMQELPTEMSLERDRLESELRGLRRAEGNQRSLMATNRGLLFRIPAAKSSLEKLERVKDSQKTLYDQLVSRHGQSEVSKQMEVQDKATTFRIVEPAVIPAQPMSPDRVKIISFGILLGIATAFALLLLLDYTDSSVKDLETLKSFGVPVLAIIPKIQNPAEILMTKRRDMRVYILSVTCFCLVIGILLLEATGSVPFKPAQLKQYLAEIKNDHMK